MFCAAPRQPGGRHDQRRIDHGNPEPFLREKNQASDDRRRGHEPERRSAPGRPVRRQRRPPTAAGGEQQQRTGPTDAATYRAECSRIRRTDRDDRVERLARSSASHAPGWRRIQAERVVVVERLELFGVTAPGARARNASSARFSSGFAARSPSPRRQRMVAGPERHAAFRGDGDPASVDPVVADRPRRRRSAATRRTTTAAPACRCRQSHSAANGRKNSIAGPNQNRGAGERRPTSQWSEVARLAVRGRLPDGWTVAVPSLQRRSSASAPRRQRQRRQRAHVE